MKKIRYLALAAALLILVANCNAAREQIQTQSVSERGGVFQEVNTADGPPPGFADVVIKASLKTHLPGEYLLESGCSSHGAPFYHFTMNIDGQAVTWKVRGVRENSPVVNGRHFPEEGAGMKYVLEKKIRLQAGGHSIFFGVPEADFTKTVSINLQEDRSYALKLRPLYPRYKWGHPASRLGFLGFNVKLDDTSIQ